MNLTHEVNYFISKIAIYLEVDKENIFSQMPDNKINVCCKRGKFNFYLCIGIVKIIIQSILFIK